MQDNVQMEMTKVNAADIEQAIQFEAEERTAIDKPVPKPKRYMVTIYAGNWCPSIEMEESVYEEFLQWYDGLVGGTSFICKDGVSNVRFKREKIDYVKDKELSF